MRRDQLEHGVDLETSALPAGWHHRLVKIQNANTAAPGGAPRYTGWCLDKEDLCVAKLIIHGTISVSVMQVASSRLAGKRLQLCSATASNADAFLIVSGGHPPRPRPPAETAMLLVLRKK